MTNEQWERYANEGMHIHHSGKNKNDLIVYTEKEAFELPFIFF